MAITLKSFRQGRPILLACVLSCGCGMAQVPVTESSQSKLADSTESAERQLPDSAVLMRAVEINQRKSEAIAKNYIYHSVETAQERDSSGKIKKTRVTEYDNFWVNGVPVRRMVKKDGKLLSPDEIAKENERIDKLAAKAAEKRGEADAEGKQTDARGNEEVTVSRLLELGAFTTPRRVQVNQRNTIAVDFAGDPKAKTRNRAEEVIRDLAGTAWIDEQDQVVVRVQGHFISAFKIGGGLVASVQKDTHFTMEQVKVNDEVWLPARFEGQGSFHALLFFGFNGSVAIANSGYQKFRATSRILPDLGPPASPDLPNDSPGTVGSSPASPDRSAGP